MKTYTVVCTHAVMVEMLQYEGSRLVERHVVSCPTWCKGDQELESMYTKWRCVVRGTPNVRRWASFGVQVGAA